MFGSHDTSPSHFSLGAITIFVRPSRSASQFVQGSDATTAPATCPALIPKPDSRYASAAIASSASSGGGRVALRRPDPRVRDLARLRRPSSRGTPRARAHARREPREPQVRARHDRRLRRDRARAARRDRTIDAEELSARARRRGDARCRSFGARRRRATHARPPSATPARRRNRRVASRTAAPSSLPSSVTARSLSGTSASRARSDADLAKTNGCVTTQRSPRDAVARDSFFVVARRDDDARRRRRRRARNLRRFGFDDRRPHTGHLQATLRAYVPDDQRGNHAALRHGPGAARQLQQNLRAAHARQATADLPSALRASGRFVLVFPASAKS